eukprot:364722-Chlamydomonas_euryale.AAC.2
MHGWMSRGCGSAEGVVWMGLGGDPPIPSEWCGRGWEDAEGWMHGEGSVDRVGLGRVDGVGVGHGGERMVPGGRDPPIPILGGWALFAAQTGPNRAFFSAGRVRGIGLPCLSSTGQRQVRGWNCVALFGQRWAAAGPCLGSAGRMGGSSSPV